MSPFDQERGEMKLITTSRAAVLLVWTGFSLSCVEPIRHECAQSARLTVDDPASCSLFEEDIPDRGDEGEAWLELEFPREGAKVQPGTLFYLKARGVDSRTMIATWDGRKELAIESTEAGAGAIEIALTGPVREGVHTLRGEDRKRGDSMSYLFRVEEALHVAGVAVETQSEGSRLEVVFSHDVVIKEAADLCVEETCVVGDVFPMVGRQFYIERSSPDRVQGETVRITRHLQGADWPESVLMVRPWQLQDSLYQGFSQEPDFLRIDLSKPGALRGCGTNVECWGVFPLDARGQ